MPDDETADAGYKRALDAYLDGDLARVLKIINAILERDPNTKLKPRLERLRRRAEERS